ncbi:MAG: hypothetical protein ACI915_004582 [Gammaproteobacteria bacterium]|jgi:hypothetical protein
MSRFFSNKWVVLALGSSALAICGFNIVGPLMDGNDLGSAMVVPAAGLEGDMTLAPRTVGTNNETLDRQRAERVAVGGMVTPENLNTLGWNPSVSRNPFSLEQTTRLELTEPGEALRALQSDEVSLPDSTVTAVVIAKNMRIAVIDGAIVRLGSTTNDGRVAEINGRTVAIKELGERIRNIPWAGASQ